MAVKTFTTEVLTSADTNTYLANSGLVYITQASWVSGGSLSVNNCFTSTYSAYKIVVRNAKHATTSADALLRMRASGTDTITGYYFARYYTAFGGASGGNSGGSNATNINAGIVASTSNAGSGVVEIIDPQKASATTFLTQGVWAITTGESSAGAGVLSNSTQYDGFTLVANSGNFTALTVFVYGYRES